MRSIKLTCIFDFTSDLSLISKKLQSFLHYEIQSVCALVCVCLCVCMSVRNRLPNHAYYGDEAFIGLG